MISPIDGDGEGDVFKTAPNSDRGDAPAITKDNGSDYTMTTVSSCNGDTMIRTAPSSIDDDPDNHCRAVVEDECIGQAKCDSANNPDNVLGTTLNKDTDNNGNDKVLETATESNIDDNSNDNVLLTDSDTNDNILKTASDSEIDKDTEDQLLEMACDSDSNENINEKLLETDSDGENNENITEKHLETVADSDSNENINDKPLETVADSDSSENINDKPLETVADSDSNENINEKLLETVADSDSNENINDKLLETVADSDSNENINDKPLETASDSDSDDVAINKGHRTKFCIESEDSHESKSDDDLLTTAPAFLKSVKEIMERPPPATPEKFVVSRQCSLNSSLELTSEPYVPKRPAMFGKSKSAYSIDSLLADKAKADEMKRFMDKIHRDLKSEGDFIQMLGKAEETVNTEQLPEEQQKVLDNFIIEDSCISDDRPGQHVFTAARYRCLFGETLHSTQCGFAVPQNPRYIEKYLAEITADQYLQLLTADIIQMCFSKVTHQGPVLRWLLFIMSVHESFGVQQGCHKVLMDLLHSQALKGLPKWSPSVVDVISILVNYGADFEDLVPAETSVSHDSIRSRLYQQPQYMPPVDGGQNGGYQLHNLRLVLEVVAYSLQGKIYSYPHADLTLLLTALCRASLDTGLKNSCAMDVFSNCVAMVVKQYSKTDWLEQRRPICRLLSRLTQHHHNKLHLAQLLAPDTRGRYLQSRVGLLMLHDILATPGDIDDDVLEEMRISGLHRYIPQLKDLVTEDPYKLSSVVSLLDLCVGCTPLKPQDREDLRKLVDQVKRVCTEIRDNLRNLDRSRVKDMMVQVSSRWYVNIQSTRSKQMKIFQYGKQDSPRKLKIQHIQTNQSDTSSSESSESESEDDSDPNTRPCKMPRLVLEIVNPGEYQGHAENDDGTVNPTGSSSNMLDVSGRSEPNEIQMEDDDLPELTVEW